MILKTPRIRKGRAVILELKVVKKFQELEEGCAAALKQAEKKRYRKEIAAGRVWSALCEG